MIPYGKPFFSADNFNLTAEGGVTFFKYLKSLICSGNLNY